MYSKNMITLIWIKLTDILSNKVVRFLVCSLRFDNCKVLGYSFSDLSLWMALEYFLYVHITSLNTVPPNARGAVASML